MILCQQIIFVRMTAYVASRENRQTFCRVARYIVLLGAVTNGAAVFIYHSYEVVEKDYIDPEGQTWMRTGDPIRNLRNDLINNNPFLNYPGDPNNASAVYQYQNILHTIQLSFMIQKNGHILLFKSDSKMARALQLRQSFDE